MTRDDATKHIQEYGGSMLDFGMDMRSAPLENPADKIYDDFESRTCGNCKHTETIDVVDNFRDNNVLYSHFRCQYMEDMFEYGDVEPDFGCSKFERKTNG